MNADQPPVICNRATYAERCCQRWYGPALKDAKTNWAHWQELKPSLLDALRAYHRDPQMETVGGKCQNPDGTLTAMLWMLQEAMQPDKSCLHPFLDFEEHFQKVFLRRGLIIYCSLLLAEIEAGEKSADPKKLELQAS